jgi:hypothetical protein
LSSVKHHVTVKIDLASALAATAATSTAAAVLAAAVVQRLERVLQAQCQSPIAASAVQATRRCSRNPCASGSSSSSGSGQCHSETAAAAAAAAALVVLHAIHSVRIQLYYSCEYSMQTANIHSRKSNRGLSPWCEGSRTKLPISR